MSLLPAAQSDLRCSCISDSAREAVDLSTAKEEGIWAQLLSVTYCTCCLLKDPIKLRRPKRTTLPATLTVRNAGVSCSEPDSTVAASSSKHLTHAFFAEADLTTSGTSGSRVYR